jgi:hypothetical protein
MDVLINSAIRKFCTSNGGKWWFLEKVTTQPTVASQQSYVLPQSTRKIIDLYVTVGTTIYKPLAVESSDVWSRLLEVQLGTSDTVEFFYRQGNNVLLYPTPSTSGNTITIRTRKNIVDLRNADYTTGTVSATLGDETITGAGTTFTAAMAGRYINLTSGDGEWYEINTFTNTTSLETVAKYEGITVTGSAFTIGELIQLPIAYHELPVYDACATFFAKEGNMQISSMFRNEADILYKNMLSEAGEKVEGAYMPPGLGMLYRDLNNPEPLISTSSFT